MTAKECLTGRRSIRNFKPDTISHELLNSIIETASYSPSWKNTQTVRYIAVEGDLKNQIATECYSIFPGNSHTAENAPMLFVLTAIKGRCGFDRDGSFSTSKKDSWQMFDAGIAAQTFCLAAWEQGLGSVIQGLYDEEKIINLLNIPDDQELIALIPVGYPDEEPVAPRRKSVDDLLLYK